MNKSGTAINPQNSADPKSSKPAAARTLRRGSRWIAMAAIVSGILAGATGIAATPASAYTNRNVSGYPGSATTPFTYAGWTSFATGTMTVPYRTVYESPQYANYDQWVCVTANVVLSSAGGAWLPAGTQSSCGWIRAAATSVVLNGAAFQMNGLGSFIYSANVVVTWKFSNNALIGTRTYDYDQVGDYRCTTGKCQVGMTTWGGGAYAAILG